MSDDVLTPLLGGGARYRAGARERTDARWRNTFVALLAAAVIVGAVSAVNA